MIGDLNCQLAVLGHCQEFNKAHTSLWVWVVRGGVRTLGNCSWPLAALLLALFPALLPRQHTLSSFGAPCPSTMLLCLVAS